MKTEEHYATEVASASGSTTIRELAELMVQYAIGCVVICDVDQRPVGILTDRDLACRVVAQGLDPNATTAADVATKPVQCVQSDEPLEAVIARMREAQIRRMPVTSGERLVGLVTLDDLVIQLGRELASLGGAAIHSIDDARRLGRRKRRRAELEETIASLEASALSAGRETIDFVTREFETLRDRLRRNP